MPPSRARRLASVPVLTGLLAAAILLWMFATGRDTRFFFSVVLTFSWLLLAGLWCAIRGRGPGWIRIGVFVLVAAGVAAAFHILIRRAGAPGAKTYLVRLWRWSKDSAPELPAPRINPVPVAELAQLPAGLADSPRFMGPLGDGVAPGAAFNPDWKSHPPREVWRKAVGLGWSGFSVVGRRAVTQEQRKHEEFVTCYDIVTGKLLWAHGDKARFGGGHGDGPRCTPTIDAQRRRVFSLGATGILNCLDLETGSVVWTRNLFAGASTENLTWGKSSSPLLHGTRVIVTGGATPPALLAFQRETGVPAWRAGTDISSYSSPVVLTLGGREQIVCVNQTSVTGHDPVAGTVLWTFPWPGQIVSKVGQPIPAGPDRILVTSCGGMKSHLLEIKRAADGTLSCDAVWTSRYPRTKFSSAAIIDGFAYALDDAILACVDLADGRRLWRDGSYGYGQNLATGDHLLIQTEPGDVVLVKSNPRHLEEIARLPALASMTWNPPTLAGRWLLVRNDREAVCYELAEP